jgi:hypothetical protein
MFMKIGLYDQLPHDAAKEVTGSYAIVKQEYNQKHDRFDLASFDMGLNEFVAAWWAAVSKTG